MSELVRKHQNSSPVNRPRLYPLWAEERGQDFRDRTDHLVAPLTPDEQAEVIPRLRTVEHFTQTFNELSVAESLRAKGFRLEYEPELNGQTPDWLVCQTSTGVRFVLEILTSNPSEDRVSRDNGWSLLRIRLENIQNTALLHIGMPDPEDDPGKVAAPPTPSRQKVISREVARWLQEGPLEGDKLTIDGITISHLGSEGITGVLCIEGAIPFWIEGEPLKEAIQEKAKKYKDLIQNLQIPLVISVVADFRTGRGMDEVVEAALGSTRGVMVRREVEQDYQHRCYREADGLFPRYRNLSAVAVSEFHGWQVRHQVLRNERANWPLPIGVQLEG